MRSLRSFVSTSLALVVAIVPGLASAYTTFPPDIEKHLALSYTIPCTICHATDSGGPPATLVHPFGQAMLNAGGLTLASTEAQVDAALDDLAKAMTDSDCNKIPDITQLQDGRDPNPPGEYIDGSNRATPQDEPAGGCINAITPVLYGCEARLSPDPPSWQGAAALVTALGLALARRRGRAVN